MSDDFNTALATSSMFGLAKEINIYYQAVTGREGVVCQEAIAEVKRIFKFMTEVIGVLEKAWEGNTGADAAEYEQLMDVILYLFAKRAVNKNNGLLPTAFVID